MLKLAWRNLWRNRTRTLIIGSAIALSYAMMLVTLGISEDAHLKMLDAASDAAGGDVLVSGDKWWETQSSDIVIAHPEQVHQALKEIAGVKAIIPRVIIGGLLSSSHGNEAVQLMGIDIDGEAKLKDPRENLASGKFLSGEFDHPIVLSTKLADKLGAGRGDKIVLTATTPAGEVTRALFRLDGTIKSVGMGEALAYTTVAAAQDAVSMKGAITQFGLIVADSFDHKLVAKQARAALSSQHLEVLTWEQAVPEMVGAVQLDDAFGYIYMIVVFIVVIFAIANTFLMAVMERVREFGLLNALGMAPKKIGALMLWETTLLAAISIVIGFGLGWGLHTYIAHVGIDLSKVYGTDVEVAGINMADMIMRSRINPLKWSIATVAVFISVLLSAAYPAWRSTKLAPAEAMRFYE